MTVARDPLCRLRCDTLIISGSVNDVVFVRDGPYGGMLISLQRVTSLRRRALANAPAASYRLLHVRRAPKL